ncbi:hypothetical protein D3C76_1089110 [compost metagenome]
MPRPIIVTATIVQGRDTTRPPIPFLPAFFAFGCGTGLPLALARSSSICGVRGTNGKNDIRPKIASSAGTNVRLAMPMIRMETLNGTANR